MNNYSKLLSLAAFAAVLTLSAAAADPNGESVSSFNKDFRKNSLEAIRQFATAVDHPEKPLPSSFHMQVVHTLPAEIARFDTDKNKVITTSEMKRTIQQYLNGETVTSKEEMGHLIDYFFNQYH